VTTSHAVRSQTRHRLGLAPPRREPRLVRVGRHELRVSVHDDGRSGTPLLLVNGIGANLEMWEPLRAELAVDAIAFDAPGTGGSPPPALPLTMAGLGRLAGDLLDELGYGRIDVLGVSFGGGVAERLAIGQPDRVRRLVLASTSYGLGAVPGSPLAVMGMLTPLRYYSGTAQRALAPIIHGRSARLQPEAAERHRAARFQRPPHPLGYTWQLVTAGTWATLPRLRHIRARTLVLAGDADPLVPLANARILTAAIPCAELSVVPGGGHLVLFERAALCADRVGRFLSAP
jgi:poly(3-hydroxyoctanoate) depolymerase